MSILDTLQSNGVTAEDLEKAASVRLFEKASAAEGLNLTELPTDSVEAQYSNINNNMEIDHMDMIDLFEKQASNEGIDLDLLDDYELAELYEHFVDDVAEDMDDDWDEDDEELLDYLMDEDDDDWDEDYDDDEDELLEKMAEAELMGEVMADSYLEKMAAYNPAPDYYKGNLRDGKKDRKLTTGQNLLARARSVGGSLGEMTRSKKGVKAKQKAIRKQLRGMKSSEQKALIKKLKAQGYISKAEYASGKAGLKGLGKGKAARKAFSKSEQLQKLMMRRANVRRGGVVGGLGAAGLAGAGALAMSARRSEKAAAAYAAGEDPAGRYYKGKGAGKKKKGVRQLSSGQQALGRIRGVGQSIGEMTRSKKGLKAKNKAIRKQLQGMKGAERKALMKKLRNQGYITGKEYKHSKPHLAMMKGKAGRKSFAGSKQLQQVMLQRANVRRGGVIGGLGAAGVAGLGALAAKGMSKEAELIDLLALEKAASWLDNDFTYDEIDELSDILAEEIMEDTLDAEIYGLDDDDWDDWDDEDYFDDEDDYDFY